MRIFFAPITHFSFLTLITLSNHATCGVLNQHTSATGTHTLRTVPARAAHGGERFTASIHARRECTADFGSARRLGRRRLPSGRL